MKRISVLLVCLATISTLICMPAKSQTSSSAKSKGMSGASFSNPEGDYASEDLSLTAPLSTPALATFQKLFGDVPNVTWAHLGRNQDRAYFVRDGITVRAGFDRKGRLIYIIRYYMEENLPKDVLYRVKATYFKKDILGVVEVTYDGKTAYVITLEDKTSWLKVKVIDDEMIEEDLFIKSK